MITPILLAIVGNEVFPGHAGWWIFYCAFTFISKAIVATDEVLRKYD